MKKVLRLALALSVGLSLVLFSWNYFRDKQTQVEWDKEQVLKAVRVQSKALEQRAKFLDIRLGSRINAYPGFERVVPLSVDCVVDEDAGEESWRYFGNDRKYSSIGPFFLLNPVFELETLEEKYGQARYKNSSKTALYVITLKGLVYKIVAEIKEEGSNANSSTRFNHFLRAVYGPCVADNGHNEVDYNSNDEMIWESLNVKLKTYGETKPNYYKVNGRITYAGSDHITNIEYVYRPLADSLAKIQTNRANKVYTEGTNKI